MTCANHSVSPALDLNRGAPVVAEAAIEIDAAPARVWETLVDVERWPEWNPEVKSVTLHGRTREGSEFRWKTGSGTISSRFRTFEPPRLVSWTGKMMGLRAIHIWSLEQNGGKTTLKTAESLEGVLARVLRRPLTKMLQKTLDTALEALRDHIEGRPHASRSRWDEHEELAGTGAGRG